MAEPRSVVRSWRVALPPSHNVTGRIRMVKQRSSAIGESEILGNKRIKPHDRRPPPVSLTKRLSQRRHSRMLKGGRPMVPDISIGEDNSVELPRLMSVGSRRPLTFRSVDAPAALL